MRILFHPGNPVHVLTALEIRSRLEELCRQPVEPWAFHLDDWFRLGATEFLVKHSIPFTHLPRSQKRPIWQQHEEDRPAVAAAYPNFERLFAETLEETRPDVFVLFIDHGVFPIGMLRLCRRFGVPSLLALEGQLEIRGTPGPRTVKGLLRRARSRLRRIVVGRPKPRVDPLAAVLPAVRPLGFNGADRIAAHNALDARCLTEHGVPPRRITVTGHPLMDRLWRRVRSMERDAVPPARATPHVLIVSSGYAHFNWNRMHDWFVPQVREFAEKTAGAFHLSLRLKPGESIRDWEKLWPDLRRWLHVLSAEDDLYAQIRAANAVVVGNSQVMMEALLLGRPVFNLTPPELSDAYRLAERGALRAAHSGAQLGEILAEPGALELRDEQMRACHVCYEEFFYRFDGRAGLRVAEVAREVMAARRSRNG